MRSVTRLPVGLAVALLLGSLAGCGGSSGHATGTGSSSPSATGGEPSDGEGGLAGAADLTTCRAAASPAPTPYGRNFPQDWPFPPDAVVFHAEDRGADGTIVTAVSSQPFKQVLQFMNTDVTSAGFDRDSGETEEHDAEAEWEGNGFHGRWAIKESADCPGDTVIQVLAGHE
ncbi:MAG: hypothetical protein QOK15_2027 [Nocardioidaceae bacterium]|nr:hypothetical protein [Nocardioidaceae bacterium]